MKNIVILGGGTAGWIAASGLARALLKGRTNEFNVTLIESDEIGTIGVGEATIPSILEFIRFLNIDERDFIKNTDATFKLGIEFINWRTLDHKYFHPFGTLGPEIDNKPLFAHWMREKLGGSTQELMELSIAAKLAQQSRILLPTQSNQIGFNNYGHALHFDAGLVAKYLKDYAMSFGVKHIIGEVQNVQKDDNGNIRALDLVSGEQISGDFFIDCSGFRSLLLGDALGVEFEDWSQYLPCDSAFAIQTEAVETPRAYTKSIAQSAGWMWQIPLRSRVGNGYVYSSNFISDDEAKQTLLNNLDSKPINEPRKIKFKAGTRKVHWKKNCLALGLASGFLEPLESTSIHLVIANLYRFLDLFPSQKDATYLESKFNQFAIDEILEIRDFIILHYCATERDDSDFWQYCSSMQIPESLKGKIELFKKSGKIVTEFYDLFKPTSWAAVMIGMGLEFEGVDALINAISENTSKTLIERYVREIEKDTKDAPSHVQLLEMIAKS